MCHAGVDFVTPDGSRSGSRSAVAIGGRFGASSGFGLDGGRSCVQLDSGDWQRDAESRS